jgi:RNA 2',3'-cyclic 3'-phosphodiesterase
VTEGGPEKLRVFVAVELDEGVRHGLAAHIDAATGGRGLPGRAVRPENWHLTLRFVGWTDPVGYERILGGLGDLDLGASFTMGFGGLGAFPRPRRATVLWLGIEQGVEELQRLAERAEEACGAAGLEPEDRPFAAHLTLSRLRPWQDVTPLVESFPRFPLRQAVDAVTVYRSHLRRSGAEYEVLERFPLTG